MELEGKVALVTGAGAGIGRAIALKLASEGAGVIVNDFSLDRAESVASEIKAMGKESIPFRADVTNRPEVLEMVAAGKGRFGTIDILVNNAGVANGFLIEDMPAEAWDRTINVNLTGAFNCTKAVIPCMMQNGRGRLIFLSSIAGHCVGGRGTSAYTASKHGIIGLMKALAWELGRYGITSNAVSPGATLTDMLKESLTPRQLEKLGADVPTGSPCAPEDIAEAVLFLASDRASQITGHSLNVDSGRLAAAGSHYREDMNLREDLSKRLVEELKRK
ncbi:MAG: SDR family NAD(P)-dependent oxidoreductase [Verrucomicrobiota bacterium]